VAKSPTLDFAQRRAARTTLCRGSINMPRGAQIATCCVPMRTPHVSPASGAFGDRTSTGIRVYGGMIRTKMRSVNHRDTVRRTSVSNHSDRHSNDVSPNICNV